MKEETRLIKTQIPQTAHKEHSAPLYFTSSYTFRDADQMAALFNEEEEGYIYSRYANPNVSELVQKVADLEKMEAGWATSTGMAAVFSTFGAFLKSGDEILSARSVFGSTHQLFTAIFPKWGIHTHYVPFDQLDTWEAAITPATKMLYLETPTNPGIDIIDLRKAAEIAKRHDLLYVVDNCFATPVNQQPALYGADIVIHSATKFFDGQGRSMGGLILGSKALIHQVERFAKHTGPALSPFNAWTLSKALETLVVRMERHNANALEMAKRLQDHPEVNWVKYPFLPSHPQYAIAKNQMNGGGGLVTFEARGGIEKGRQFLNRLQLFNLTANLGDTRSIATHPASTTHSKLTEEERQKVGISPGLIRLSIGLEHIEDIWDDAQQALN